MEDEDDDEIPKVEGGIEDETEDETEDEIEDGEKMKMKMWTRYKRRETIHGRREVVCVCLFVCHFVCAGGVAFLGVEEDD